MLGAIKGVRRGGTVSVSGVYGGEVDPLPMMEMFDRGIQLRMGQAHVRRWTDEILPLVLDPSDPRDRATRALYIALRTIHQARLHHDAGPPSPA